MTKRKHCKKAVNHFFCALNAANGSGWLHASKGMASASDKRIVFMLKIVFVFATKKRALPSAAQVPFGKVYCCFDTRKKCPANAENRKKQPFVGRKTQVAPV
jgi:hypothetical protein